MQGDVDVGLLPDQLPPEGAPPSALLSPWLPLHVRHYDQTHDYRGVTRAITDRYLLDETRVAVDDVNGPPLRVGDNVLWVGEVEDWDHRVVWAPAPVVGETTLQSGAQFVQNIGDTAAVPLFTHRSDWSQGDPSDRFCPVADVAPVLMQEFAAGPRRVAPLVRFAALQLFGQLDRCPRCAGSLAPVLFGEPAGPPTASWPEGGLNPSDFGADVLLGGCLFAPSVTAVGCRRCDLQSTEAWEIHPAGRAALGWPWSLWLAVLEAEIRVAAGLASAALGAGSGGRPVIRDAVSSWTHEGPVARVTVQRPRSRVDVRVNARFGSVQRV